MSKELKTLVPSVVLKFVDGLLKRYEGKTDYNIYITKDWLLEIKQCLERLESIDNSNPSEALECWKWINATIPQWVREKDKEHQNVLEPIKQALLKAQEPKKYLKWEDLEFKEERQEIPVRMGETIYTLVLRKTDGSNKIAKLLSPKRNYMGEWGDIFYEEAKQFFNDLHLERVEE